MGIFDNQVRERIAYDDDLFADSFAKMANLLNDDADKLAVLFHNEQDIAKEAVGDILNYYGVRAKELPETITELDDVLEFLLRPSGIMRRSVYLSENWYEDAAGAMLGATKEGKVIALIPGKVKGYYYRDPDTETITRITSKNISDISRNAICFYKPFPLKELGIKDLLVYIFKLLRIEDYLLMGGLTLVVTLIGLMTPMVNHFLFNEVIEYNSYGLLAAALTTLLFAAIASGIFDVVKNLVNTNVQMKLDMAVESATMIRILSLPPDFFKEYNSGELASRVDEMNNLCSMLFDAIFSTGLSSIFSFVFVTQVLVYAPALLVPSLIVTLTTIAFSTIVSIIDMKRIKYMMVESGKENGLVLSLIGGIAKIRNAGAEKRAFSKWAAQYVKSVTPKYKPPFYVSYNAAIVNAVTLVGTLVLYYIAIKTQISVADYMAFDSAYGMVSAAIASLAGIALTVSELKPSLEMIEPILKTKPEVSEEKHVVTRLSGSIEINNVSFRYKDNMPLVLDNISLKIKPRQYIAIVGKTGCGKSTLMRLLLGFEQPTKGAIYYDGKDIQSLDLRSLRRRIGTVMQQGKLFQGDIFSNITISAPELTLNDAWEAARMAGMEEDIENMPMGMNTLISEGQGGISGGQRQRLMIARAIAPKPSILMFDEATSALDNLTQKIVSESLDNLNCTRIVIAHRLSTIRHCDRIIVLDSGKIVEDGNYDELIQKDGFFANLVKRQRIDV